MSNFVLPMGFDFADGVTVLPTQPLGSVGTPHVVGTPLPTAFIDLFGNVGDGKFEEPPGSPKLERAEQCTCEHTLKMLWTDCQSYWSQMPRGLIVSDSAGNIWRILSCDETRIDATMGTLHYVMESISFDTPPDEFDLLDVSLDLDIIKHPRYSWALSPYVSDSSTYTLVGDTKIYYTDIKESIIRMIQNYTDSPFYPSAAQVQGLIQSSILSMLSPPTGDESTTQLNLQINYPNVNFNGSQTPDAPAPWDGTTANIPTSNCPFFVINVPVNLTVDNDPINIAISAAKELISKKWRGEDTPYIPSHEVTWTQKFFQTVYLNPGAYVEDPRDWVPDYFMNPNHASSVIPRGNQNSIGPVGPPSTDNSDTVPAGGSMSDSIFDFMSTINPQLFSTTGISGGPLSISSLRKSDRIGYDRTFFPVIHKWVVSCIGKWDVDLYNNDDRPQVASDYNQLPASFG